MNSRLKGQTLGDSDAAHLLARVRPVSTPFGIPATTFTHGDLPGDR